METRDEVEVTSLPVLTRAAYFFLILRMILAAFVVGAGIMIVQVTNSEFPVYPLYALLAASVLAGGAVYSLIKLGAPIRSALWALMLVDLCIEAAVIHFSGGISSQFSMIYSLTIVAAAFLLAMPGGLVSAIIASLMFVTYGMAETIGVVVPPGRELLSAPLDGLGLLDTYMHVSLFFLVGAMGGYLSRHIRLKGRELASAETELRQLKVDTGYILNHMSSGILVTDGDGIIISVNPAAEEILGVTMASAVGRELGEALDHSAPELTRELRHALAGGLSRKRHEITVQTAGSRPRPLGTSISLLRDEAGSTRGVISVFQDLTEVHEMRERVRKADRLAAIGELSAGIAHELRNPLASISGSIEMLSGELELKDEHERLMELILRESDRLDRIISDFLDFARLRLPTRRPTPVDEVVDEVLTLLRHNAAKSEGITLELIRLGNPPMVRVDDEQIRQVFTNLAVNSCEAMKGKGVLEVEVSVGEEETVLVCFRDSGPGIKADAAARLFEPFFTTKEGGTGLGLAIANKIVMAHGGSISYRERDTGGAEFRIVLPIGRLAGAGREENIGADELALTAETH